LEHTTNEAVIKDGDLYIPIAAAEAIDEMGVEGGDGFNDIPAEDEWEGGDGLNDIPFVDEWEGNDGFNDILPIPTKDEGLVKQDDFGLQE